MFQLCSAAADVDLNTKFLLLGVMGLASSSSLITVNGFKGYSSDRETY